MIDMTAVLGGIIGGMIYTTALGLVHLGNKSLVKRKIQKKHMLQRERIEEKKRIEERKFKAKHSEK
jgi:hypothetical protein